MIISCRLASSPAGSVMFMIATEPAVGILRDSSGDRHQLEHMQSKIRTHAALAHETARQEHLSVRASKHQSIGASEHQSFRPPDSKSIGASGARSTGTPERQHIRASERQGIRASEYQSPRASELQAPSNQSGRLDRIEGIDARRRSWGPGLCFFCFFWFFSMVF